jgi:hypothetical protein
MTYPNWLDTPNDVTWDEFRMADVPVDALGPDLTWLAEAQAEAEQAHWEEERDYLALYFDMGDDDR